LKTQTSVGAHLPSARLRDAHLEGASLGFANFQEARLLDAHLEHAQFSTIEIILGGRRKSIGGTHFEKAYIGGAHFEHTHPDDASLEEAMADKRTVWPAGFDAESKGVVIRN
jgi:uncharacterized protein YjbI with pentapeptide repeats